jgi:Gram-negative bacterial TonB protein C-terminal
MRAREFDWQFQRGGHRDAEDLVVRLNAAAPLAISRLVVTAIFSQINEGLQRGGAEIGGLLVGPKTGNGAVLVDEIVPIETRSEFGSSFHLATGELADLEHTVRSVPLSKTVAGIYRSRVQGEERLRESDHEILRVVEKAHASFDHDFRFFVLFDPVSRFAMCAAVACRESADWKEWRQFTMRIYPSAGGLPAVEMWAEDRPSSTRASAAAVSEDSETETRGTSPRILNLTAEPNTADAGQSAKSFPSDWFNKHADFEKHTFPAPEPIRVLRPPAWKYLAAIAIFAVLGAVYGTFRGKRLPPVENVQRIAPAPAPAPVSAPNSHVGFSANPQNSLWKLTWDRDAVASLHPTAAVLSILDGGQERRIPLSAPDLATGEAFYSARTGELLFSLKVNVPGAEPVEEHVRVLEADRVAVLSPEVRGQKAPAEVVTRSVRPFDPAAAAPKPAREDNQISEMPAPPPVSALSAPLRVPIPSQPPLPTPVALQVRGASYSPPQAIHRVSPMDPQHRPRGTVSVVDVVVEIDETGKVTRVTPTELTPVNFDLVAVAMHAAKDWRFRAAIQDGRPVASQMNLSFKFGAK